MKRFDVCVRGAGIVGRALALSLARQGLQVALVQAAAADDRPDVRAYALNAASVALLRGLKVWDALPVGAATAVHDMHIQGDAPSGVLAFSAWQQHVAELAWITDAAVLTQALAAAVRFAPHVSVVPEPLDAPLQAVCDGRDSQAREVLGVSMDRQDYGHRAIAARLTSPEPHRHTARQWFRHPDVLALLPFDSPQTARSYALVWSMPEDRAQELLALDTAAFEAELNAAAAGAPALREGADSLPANGAAHGAAQASSPAPGAHAGPTVGHLVLASDRASWPLVRARAAAWSGPGWVLLGDAAHVVHPLAGQGLNLGLGDVVVLSRVIAEREHWRTVGDARLLRRYERERQVPVAAMAHVTDGLLQLFAHDHAALRELRNRGMGLVNHLTPLKRWLTSRALGA